MPYSPPFKTFVRFLFEPNTHTHTHTHTEKYTYTYTLKIIKMAKKLTNKMAINNMLADLKTRLAGFLTGSSLHIVGSAELC